MISGLSGNLPTWTAVLLATISTRRTTMRIALALAAVTAAVAGSLTAGGAAVAHQDGDRTSATQRVVVRPVDASGHARPGWTVHRMKGLTADCSGSAAGAVDDGIYACFPTAAYLPACWPSRHHTVLCLRDARTDTLVRVRYSGVLGVASAPKRPSPQDLDLARGQGCALRVGGAWGILPTHPGWVGFYSCTHGSVYGPADGDGINRSAQPWTVHVWRSGTHHRVSTRPVAVAYFVGTHS
jgi:hypothetical protein